MEGKREGKGEENSQLGLHYKGQWKNDQKWGPGEEKTLVGTTFTGTVCCVYTFNEIFINATFVDFLKQQTFLLFRPIVFFKKPQTFPYFSRRGLVRSGVLCMYKSNCSAMIDDHFGMYFAGVHLGGGGGGGHRGSFAPPPLGRCLPPLEISVTIIIKECCKGLPPLLYPSSNFAPR